MSKLNLMRFDSNSMMIQSLNRNDAPINVLTRPSVWPLELSSDCCEIITNTPVNNKNSAHVDRIIPNTFMKFDDAMNVKNIDALTNHESHGLANSYEKCFSKIGCMNIIVAAAHNP